MNPFDPFVWPPVMHSIPRPQYSTSTHYWTRKELADMEPDPQSQPSPCSLTREDILHIAREIVRLDEEHSISTQLADSPEKGVALFDDRLAFLCIQLHKLVDRAYPEVEE